MHKTDDLTDSINGLVQDCSISIANVLEILQSSKPSIHDYFRQKTDYVLSDDQTIFDVNEKHFQLLQASFDFIVII